MSYMKIHNLYKARDILLFRECYAMEKVHGTSTWISWRIDKKPHLSFFSGGVKHANFIALFNQEELTKRFTELGREKVRIVGEGYGGKCQGMKETYGPDLSFIAFEVQIGNYWLSVPDAEKIVNSLGLEFIPYKLIPTTLEAIDTERDADSIVAIRRGTGEGKKREGVVLRPPIELRKNNNERIIAKHKRDDFRETKTPRNISAEKLERLTKGDDIAKEWVVEQRLQHVLSALFLGGTEPDISDTGKVIKAMTEDIKAESEGEIEWSKEAVKAINARTAKMFKQRLKEKKQ